MPASAGTVDLGEGADASDPILTESQLEAPIGSEPEVTPIVRGYSVLPEARRGGQGTVFAATQLSTGRRVAIKILRGGPLLSSRGRTRFEREAKVLASLDHPNIVRIVDRDTTPDGSAFLVMDYVAGPTLDACAIDPEDRSPGRQAELLKLFVKVSRAVDAAHQVGIVHRDLKPSNIRLDESGEPRVLDFGLARVVSPRGPAYPSVTTTGEFIGSLEYASPEQAEGTRALDSRSDVYSLGVMLYQLLTGCFPYAVAGPLPDVLRNIIREAPTPPSRASRSPAAQGRRSRLLLRPLQTPRVDPELDAILLKALAKRREDRYERAGHLADDLECFLAGARPTAIEPYDLSRRRPVWSAALAAVLISATAAALWIRVRPGVSASAAVRPPANEAASTVPLDAMGLEGHAYKAFVGEWTWEDACSRAREMGGHLAVVEGQPEERFVENLCRRARASGGFVGMSWWLGLESDGVANHRSVLGTVPPYVNFPRGLAAEPRVLPVCLRLSLWYLAEREDRLAMVVEWDTPPPAGAPAEVPLDAAAFGGHRYKLYHEPLTWEEAKAACSRVGGVPICIESEDEDRFVGHLIGDGCSDGVWTGARLFGNRLFWANGAASLYRRWGLSRVRDDEAVYWRSDGWQTTNADLETRRLPYICEWTR